ncbi:hypothetical protein CMT41_18080 [Colwellia sp. MT41]|uniref:hypothetical protein n=1 Tax=Colwellia sp. MT41 TaxID=58049 RepID=UPI0007179EDD|nr:hypothetical protein [Colwellia sp. MT41]ALO36438.1 hypothetical protein CMT41_18080 [Colwellia sp. MT41]
MKSKFFNYFVYSGLCFHLLLVTVFLWQPQLLLKIYSLSINYYYNKIADYEYSHLVAAEKTVEQQIDMVFIPWQSIKSSSVKSKQVAVNGIDFINLNQALENLKDGDELQFYSGVFDTPFLIDKNDITITGVGHVVFEKSAYNGKAFIVNKGRNLTIKNIECRYISVADKNGACVRQEGLGLTLEHVYFHHSENGILESAKEQGNIYIRDSRFELLGKNGRAHAIYSNKANLYIENSLFIASKDEGHTIKNRGAETYITHSLITSMSSNDSRLLDISNGGVLNINYSLLHQGPLSANGQAISFGLEGIKHDVNSIRLQDNIILLERIKQNVLLATGEHNIDSVIAGNIIINKDAVDEFQGNFYFENRDGAGFPKYPYFPKVLCQLITPCPLLSAD